MTRSYVVWPLLVADSTKRIFKAIEDVVGQENLVLGSIGRPVLGSGHRAQDVMMRSRGAAGRDDDG